MKRMPLILATALLIGGASLLSGCNSLPQNIALGAGLATVTGAMIPGHDIEQIYYLGAFDPQEQIPPSLFRVRVRGQASIISWMRFGSGWVPADIIDSLGSNPEYAKALGVSSAERLNTGKSSNLTLDRRLIQFGPEGFREVPKNHRLVLVMGASPENFFDAMDRALGDLSSASITESDSALHRDLFEALTLTKSERELLDSALRDLQQDWAQAEGK